MLNNLKHLYNRLIIIIIKIINNKLSFTMTGVMNVMAERNTNEHERFWNEKSHNSPER